MDNWKQIITFLLENRGKPFTINHLSKELKLNYRLAYQEIAGLEKEGIIQIVKVGHSNQCTLTNIFNEKIFAVECRRKEQFLRNKGFKTMANRFSKVKDQFILLVFGSYAKKTQHKQSDIDLLLIAKDDKEIKREIEMIPLPIHLTSISYEDFIDMLQSKKASVVAEAVQHNIILFGIEDYYRLIQHAE